MDTDDIVVTGLGATTPLGGDVATTWTGMLAGRSGVVTLTDWPADVPVQFGGRMAVEPGESIPRAKARRMDRVQQAALVAAKEAWEDAGFKGFAEDNGLDPERLAVSIGSGIGGVVSLMDQHELMLAKGATKVSPMLIPMDMPNGPAAYVSLEYHARAGAFTPVSACATGSEAIAWGVDLLQLDRADIVLAGGAEACMHPLTFSGFAQMRAMSTRNDDPQRASRPWDKARDGFVMGEGAGVVVLERRASAEARGAHIYAVVAGAAVTSDGYHITTPDPDGAGQRRAMMTAVQRSGLYADDIVHVNAHATSTPAGDMGEVRAVSALLGNDTVVTATKSMTGHLIGAAGALESIITVLSIQNGIVPPTINLDDPDDDLCVDVPRTAREMDVPAAINNSFGFGGHNASIVFRRK